MGSSIAASISIGGELPKRFVFDLCDIISQQGAGLDWGESNFRPSDSRDLLAALDDEDQILKIYDDSATNGQFDDLEAFLVKNKIAFDRETEPDLSYAGEIVQFRPDMVRPYSWIASEGAPYIRRDNLSTIVNNPELTEHDQLEAIKKELGPVIPPLTPLVFTPVSGKGLG